jgi:hypothetical protein
LFKNYSFNYWNMFLSLYFHAEDKFSLYIDVSQENILNPAWKELEKC